MLSFEITKPEPGQEPTELEIYFDAEGLKALLAQLAFLEQKRTDHVHLMCDGWGGTHLSDTPVSDSGIPIRHVRISKIKDSGI